MPIWTWQAMECKEVCISGGNPSQRSNVWPRARRGRKTDRLFYIIIFFNCLTRQTDWGVNWWSCSSVCIVLSLCLCQQVEMLIRTLNIQYADCGMGFERRCQRKAGCPLLGFNRDAGQSLPFPASPSTLFTPKIRLGSKQSWLIFKSRNSKRRWRVGGEERGKGDNSCD